VYPALAVLSRSRLECRTRRPRGGIASLQQEFRAYDAQARPRVRDGRQPGPGAV